MYDDELKLPKAPKMSGGSIVGTFAGLALLITTLMIGCPTYDVYTSKMKGQAQLAHAQASKEVQVAEAKAKMESAMYEAMADTTRAHGVARANEIIGQSLNNNQAYLKWLFISELSKQSNVIYVPTEAGIPVLEAGRLNELNRKRDTLQKQ